MTRALVTDVRVSSVSGFIGVGHSATTASRLLPRNVSFLYLVHNLRFRAREKAYRVISRLGCRCECRFSYSSGWPHDKRPTVLSVVLAKLMVAQMVKKSPLLAHANPYPTTLYVCLKSILPSVTRSLK